MNNVIAVLSCEHCNDTLIKIVDGHRSGSLSDSGMIRLMHTGSFTGDTFSGKWINADVTKDMLFGLNR